MIITAQPFFNELDLLEIKCRELEGVVDAHVVVESELTFTGLRKPLYFLEHAERFKRWRIIHHVVKLPEVASSPWEREAIQYAAVKESVREVCPEICIWVDADEIPRRNTVARFDSMMVPTATLDMDHILFSFDRVDATQRWTNAKIGWYNPHAVEQPWRGTTGLPVIPGAGWHFEYFGRREELLAKLAAVSHAPEPGCQDMARRVALGEFPGVERTVMYPRSLLPRCVQNEIGFDPSRKPLN